VRVLLSLISTAVNVPLNLRAGENLMVSPGLAIKVWLSVVKFMLKKTMVMGLPASMVKL